MKTDDDHIRAPGVFASGLQRGAARPLSRDDVIARSPHDSEPALGSDAELAPESPHPDEATGISRKARRRPEDDGTLEASEERYRALIDAMPDLVLRLTTDGTVLSCEGDPSFPLAYSLDAMIGSRLADLLPEPIARLFQRGIVCAAQTGNVQILEYSMPTSAGLREREARIAARGGLVTTIVRDVTDQKRGEVDRNQHVARVEMLDAISRAFAGATLEYAAALDLAVRRTSELIGDLCVLVGLGDRDRSLVPIAFYDRHSPVRERVARLLSIGPLPVEHTPLERVLDLGDTLLANDVADADLEGLVQPAQRALLLSLGVHAVLAVPMRVHGRITGALILFRHRSGLPYGEEDAVFAQAIADRAAVAIYAARLYSENQRQAEALRSANRDLERRITERTAELARLNDLLRQQATEDGLTGLANRRHFQATLELEIRRARRHGDELSLLLCDVDFFKRFNDAHGHVRGDECLKQVADVIKNAFRRAGDLVARYGGEEFAVILPGCGAAAALALGERLREAMESLGVPHGSSDVSPSVTLSVGSASTLVGPETTAQSLTQMADEALYASKANGRNRVTRAVLPARPEKA